MRRLPAVRVLRRLLMAVVLAALLAGATVAFSYWTAHGSGSASATSGMLALPTNVTATATATRGTVSVSWTGAVGPDGNAITHYYVQRLAGATPSNACGTSPSSPLTSPPATCSDTGVADGTYTYTVTAVWHSWTSVSTASSPVTVRPSAPTTVSLANGGGTGGAYIDSANTASVSVDVGLGATSLASDAITLTLHDAGSAHTVTRTASATAGAGSVHVTGLDLSAFNDGTVTMSATATDTVAGVSTALTTTATRDTVAPAAPTSVTLSNGLGTASAYINATNAGSLNYSVVLPNNANDAATDTITVTLTSGAAASGTHAGLSPAGGTVGVTGIVATSLTDGSVAVSATATDLAGNISAATTTTTTKDTVAPAAPTSVSIANGLGTGSAYINATNAASVNYNVVLPSNANDSATDTITVTLTSGAAASGTHAGLSSAGGTVGVTGIVATSLTDGSVAVGATATDLAGNVSSAATTTTAKDTLAPTAPAPTLSGATGNTFISGTTVYIDPQAGKSGGFTVTDAPTDGTVGIQKVTFPALTGFTSGGGNVSTSPYTTTYAWSGAGATASGSQTITVTNNAGMTSTTTFTVTPDTVGPSVTALCGGSACPASQTKLLSGSVAVSISATDSGSGLASLSCTLDGVTQSCASFTVNGLLGTRTVAYTATDRVGNVTTGSFTITFIL